jgi:hypothetical protein
MNLNRIMATRTGKSTAAAKPEPKKTLRKAAAPEEDVDEDVASDVESDGDVGHDEKEAKIPGLHYSSKGVSNDYAQGKFYAVNRYTKANGHRVGNSMSKQLMANYYAIKSDLDNLAKAKKGAKISSIIGLSDDLVNYANERGLTAASFANEAVRRDYVASRHYVYLSQEWNMCGPFEDVAYVIATNSGTELDTIIGEVEDNAFHFGNIGDREASDYYSDLMGLARFDDADLDASAEAAQAIEAEYQAAAEAFKLSKISKSAKNYNLDDIVKVAAELKSRDSGAGSKPKASPTGRIDKRVPILTKLANLKEGQVLKIQKYAENKTASPQKPPADPSKSRFVIIDVSQGGPIMVEHRVDLEALIATILKESPDKFTRADGTAWLSEFDALKLAKNKPALSHVAVGARRTAVATKPKATATRVVKNVPARSPAAAKPAPKAAAKPKPAAGKVSPAKAPPAAKPKPKLVPAMESEESASSSRSSPSKKK